MIRLAVKSPRKIESLMLSNAEFEMVDAYVGR